MLVGGDSSERSGTSESAATKERLIEDLLKRVHDTSANDAQADQNMHRYIFLLTFDYCLVDLVCNNFVF